MQKASFTNEEKAFCGREGLGLWPKACSFRTKDFFFAGQNRGGEEGKLNLAFSGPMRGSL